MILGVDIGLSGGLALYDGENLEYFPMPVLKTEVGNELEAKALWKILSDKRITHAYIEKQNVRPMDGKKGVFKHGGQYFTFRALMTILEVPVTYVAKQTWGRAMMPDMDRKIKESSFNRVRQIFPKLPEFRKKDDGIVEAILIAKYGHDIEKAS